jgi:class 3 adenylate cyclase
MSDERVERRLAAILAGDVVGYSRLMGVDEVGTLRALKAIRRELADPTIAAHHGRVVKTTGDGILIEFPSVVDAVACAVAIQDGMVARNAGVREVPVKPLKPRPSASFSSCASIAGIFAPDARPSVLSLRNCVT